MITLPAALESHIKNGGNYCHLITLNTTPAAIYLTDCAFNVPNNGNTYLGNGLLIDFKAVTLRSEISVNKSKITFSAVEQSMTSVLLNTRQINRNVIIERAYLNADGTVLATLPFTVLQIVGEPSISSDFDKATISLPVASIWSDFNKINGRRSTTASQQKEFPNDTGHFLAADAGKEYKWGRK